MDARGCISGLVRTGKSNDDADLAWALLIAARATSDQLESSVHLLGLAQETSEKSCRALHAFGIGAAASAWSGKTYGHFHLGAAEGVLDGTYEQWLVAPDPATCVMQWPRCKATPGCKARFDVAAGDCHMREEDRPMLSPSARTGR